MSRNVTIVLSDEAARWIRLKAAEADTSVSRLVGQMLERQMRQSDEYWQAFERWNTLVPEGGVPGVDASQRWAREQIHANRQ